MLSSSAALYFFFFNDTATTDIYTLSLHDALPICDGGIRPRRDAIERDLDEARRILGEQVGRPLGDHRAFGVGRRENPPPLEPAIDVEEVGADEDLATGQEQPEPARIHDLAGDAVDLDGAELVLASPPVAGREIDPAVRARQIAAIRQLPAAFEGHVRHAVAALDALDERAVTDRRNGRGGGRHRAGAARAPVAGRGSTNVSRSNVASWSVTWYSPTMTSRISRRVRRPSRSSQIRAPTSFRV